MIIIRSMRVSVNHLENNRNALPWRREYKTYTPLVTFQLMTDAYVIDPKKFSKTVDNVGNNKKKYCNSAKSFVCTRVVSIKEGIDDRFL